MPDVERYDTEAEVKSRGSNDQIFKGDDVAESGLLAFELTGKPGDVSRDRMDEEVAEDVDRQVGLSW